MQTFILSKNIGELKQGDSFTVINAFFRKIGTGLFASKLHIVINLNGEEKTIVDSDFELHRFIKDVREGNKVESYNGFTLETRTIKGKKEVYAHNSRFGKTFTSVSQAKKAINQL